MASPLTNPAAAVSTSSAFKPSNLPPGLPEKARELEGVFLNTLMSQMFSSIETEGSFGGGYAEETWRSMQAEQMAQQLAQSGGIGLADEIMRNLLTLQEATNSPSSPDQGTPQR